MPSASSLRITVDGKFFRAGTEKVYVKGVTYGPFAPNQQGEMFPTPEQTGRDFVQIRELGGNVLRLYYVPPEWFMDLAAEHQLRLLVDIPWPKHLCFLDSKKSERQAREAVRNGVRQCREHSAVFACSVVNEISPEIARWSGISKVERFINELVDEARNIDPHCLYTFTSFPPTEFLQPENIDFVCFNVYLHERAAFESYLARLQSLADSKPLLLGEVGMDSLREGEQRKCAFLAWQIEAAFRSGLAGTVLFSYTDDWFRGGMQIEDWAFGLTTRDRRPKDSFHVVKRQYQEAPHFQAANSKLPKVSVVVATYNGARTLKLCLDSLSRLNYPDYEVIVVDDGSTDATADIAQQYASTVRYIRQDNFGLSVARNTGISAAKGEIVAFTDDDCRADEDWLYYLVSDLITGKFVGIGGHNLLPPDDSPVAAAVVVSPGGPAHVMLTDREAEHVPGCNMAFYKWALDAVGGFDPVFRKAGDDVDLCWRLQDRGHKIGFSHAGFVWHYRRSTVKAYLKQQAGYGEAEALLIQKHPEHFNSFGGGIWRGHIYTAARAGLVLRPPVIYHGPFASGFFQRLYTSEPALPLMLCTSLPYHIFINLPLLILSLYLDFLLPLAVVSIGISVSLCIAAAAQAKIPRTRRRFWSRPLVALLFFLQPIVRGWNRFKWRLNLRSTRTKPMPESPVLETEPTTSTSFWSARHLDRCDFLHGVLTALQQLGWAVKPDTGWSDYDAEIIAGWSRLRITTVSEELEGGKTNFHCRLRSTWSLGAIIVFWAGTLATSLLIAFFAKHVPWLWMLPAFLVLLHWFLNDEKLLLQQSVARSLEQAACDHNLVKLPA